MVKKVVVPGIFLAALSSPLFMEEAHAASVTKYVEVNKGSVLNVRFGPSISTSVVTILKAGEKVNVLSETNGWSKVEVDGKIGYVSSSYLITKQVSSVKYVSVDPSSTLNVRESASTKANVVTKLKNNTKVEVVSESNGWAKIKVNGINGYVSSQYIKAVQTEEKKTTNSSNKQQKVTKYVNVNTGSSLNLRNSPSNSASIIVKLAKDVPVTVYSESNGWSKVEAYGKQGYVATQYLTEKKGTASPEKKEETKTSTSEKAAAKYVNVEKNSSLNVRKEASTNSAILTKLSRGTEVKVLSSANGWDKVTVSGKTGYVSSSYLSVTKITETTTNNKGTDKNEAKQSEKAPTGKQMKVNVQAGSNLNVRSTASTSGSIKGKLSAGTVVTVLSEKNGWSQIKTSKVAGYVSSEYLTSISTPDKETDKNEAKQPEETPTVTEKIVNVQAGSSLNLRSTPSTSGKILSKLQAGTVVIVQAEGNGWSKVKVNNLEGYVSSEYLSSKGNGSANATINKSYVNYNLTLEEMTNIQLSVNPQTDKKYDTYIREDAIAFKTADSTKGTVIGNGWRLRGGAGTDYSVVSTLTSGQVLTVTSKIKGTDGYYWYKVNYSQSWVTASKEDTAYYLNPNNFINSDTQSLQFLKLSAKANVDDKEVDSKILAGKGILAGKASSFVTAANAYGINEIYLISHALLETGNGTSTLANGVQVNGKTVYNMYGIGAYDGSAVSSGAQYAYNAGWFTPEAAIIGGAKFIAQGYVNAGQDTLYKMRWNPDAAEKTGNATHQYASDIGWATKQVGQIYNLYSLLSSYTLNYEIPIYKVNAK
ncbi:SH3 domain-containing protein [Niallia circulans]|uniref:SH3 domain-containing protein n=1 Tax=Niallia circulans TaxID=1397 RepID=UPI002E1ED348|nr:SH3 domain-containing protein [Niallia circulans]